MSDSNKKDINNNPSSRSFCGVIEEAANIYHWRYNFPDFFEAVTGHVPYPYQSDFLNEMADLSKQYAIISAGRGTGKTECLAVLALWYVYVLPLTEPGVPMKVVILAGSEKQARICYGYIMGFISRIPFLQKALAKDPTAEEIIFSDGSEIKPLTASEKSVRGPHPDLLIIDEACFLAGTKVIKNADLVNIEEMKIGDKVLTASGYFKPVERLFKRKYIGPIISIKLPGTYQRIRLTPNHPILALKRKFKNIGYQKSKMEKPKWIRAEELEKGDLIFQAVPKRNIRKLKTIEIKTPKTALKLNINQALLRLIGYYLAEGSRNKDRVFFSFSSKEIRLQHEVKTLINEILGSERAYISKCPRNTSNVVISSRALAKFLSEEFGYSSENKCLSERFWSLPLEDLSQIFETLFLGDGYSEELEELHIKSRKLATQFYLFLCEKRLIPSIYKDKNQNAWKVYFSLTRKANKRFLYKSFLVGAIKDLKIENFKGEVYNLKVKDDPSYTLPSVTVHNCQASDDLLTAALPMIGTSAYPRLILSSTPDTFFSLFVSIYNKSNDYPQFKRFNWSAEKCPLVSSQFLKGQQTLMDSGNYQVEYLGLPYSFVGKVFDLDKLKECVKWRNLIEGEFAKYAGVDWGHYPAPTVVTIVEKVIMDDKGKTVWVVLHTEPFLKQNFEDVLDKVEMIVRSYQVSSIYTDSNDIGENQRLAGRGLPVYPVKFKSQKATMLSNLRALVENELIKIDGAKDYPLVAEMRDYRYDTKKNDDFVDSLMLAVKPASNRTMPTKWDLKEFMVISKKEEQKMPNPHDIKHQMEERYVKPSEAETPQETELAKKLSRKTN